MTATTPSPASPFRSRSTRIRVGLGGLAVLALASGCAGGGGSSTSSNAATEQLAARPPVAPAGSPAPELVPATTATTLPPNPYVQTALDPLSTFGLDVDTGSYTLGRREIEDGQRPSPASVRVEEYVNSFQQGYANPLGGAFGLTVDGTTTPFVKEVRHRLVRVGVKARDIDDSFRKDAALTFVIDTSGSMDQENRLGLVKRSLHVLVDELRPTDTVAIVEFGTESRVVLPPTPVRAKEDILGAVDGLEPQGSTNAEAGLLQAYALADQSFKPNGINRVVLASDGGANVGATDGTTLAREISAHSAKGIQLAGIGFGMEGYNDALMEQLADKGEGFYAYVDDVDEARRIFAEKLTSTLQTVALDAKAQVSFDPAAVSSYRLLGYENRAVIDSEFRNDGQNGRPKADGGEIGAGHQVTALYEVELAPEAANATTESTLPMALGTVTLHWTDVDERTPVEMTAPITTDVFRPWSQASERLRLDAVVAQYAEVLRESPWTTATLGDVVGEAHRLPASLREDPDVQELVQLMDRAATLR